jgi:hypothetical protein
MIGQYIEPELERRLRDHPSRQAERDWAELIEVVTELTRAINAEQAAGTEPTDARMLELARQWRALLEHFILQHPPGAAGW